MIITMITLFILALLGLCIYIAVNPERFVHETNHVFMRLGYILGYIVEMLNPVVKVKNDKK